MNEKNFNGFLVLNWKTNSVRLIQKKNRLKGYNPYEIPVPYNIKIKLPEYSDVKGIIINTELPIIDVSTIKM